MSNELSTSSHEGLNSVISMLTKFSLFPNSMNISNIYNTLKPIGDKSLQPKNN